MNKPDKDPLKLFLFYQNADNLIIQQVEPVNTEQINELKQLSKKGLTKCVIIDPSTSFIAASDALQKLVADTTSAQEIGCEIINRAPASHDLVQIYAENIRLRKIALTPEQYQQRLAEENAILTNG